MRLAEKTEYPFLARIIFWFQKRKYGEALLPSKLWARSPQLLYGLQVFYRALDRKSSPLEPSLRVLLNARVSQLNHCAFCVDISASILKKLGISEEKVAALAIYEKSQEFSARERMALAYAEAITLNKVNDSLFERLRAIFSEDEILELTALVAYQNLSSKFNAALDVPSQGFCAIGKKT
jgi:AhpD family alkylhydroperoxidase